MRRVTAVAVVLGLALAAGCAGATQDGSGSGSASSREGTLIYHRPASPGLSQITIAFSTDPELADDYGHERVVVGTRGGGALSSENAETILKRQLQSAGSPPPRRVSPREFGSLWTGLQATGLFDLPQHPADAPPPKTEWFAVESGGDKRAFVRPPSGASALDLERWKQAKLLLVQFQIRPPAQ